MTFNIPISKTLLRENEINAALIPLKSGWLVQGKKVLEFENQWSSFTGTKYSIAVNSCTSGLELALRAMGIKSGDEIIVPAFTWISSASVIEHVGAKPVFCDISIDSFNVDVEKIEKLITKKTKCIIVVHLFGRAADMVSICDLAATYNLKIIEDAACGFGSYNSGEHVGTIGDIGVFSFHPRKSITTGEGGMVVTNNPSYNVEIRKLRDHGAKISDLQRHEGAQPYLLAEHDVAGFNYRLTDIQASIGVEQMKRCFQIIEERRQIAKTYINNFRSLEYLVTPQIDEVETHGFQSFACLFKPIDLNLQNLETIHTLRNNWMRKLQDSGVSTRPATHAIHMLQVFAEKYGLKPTDFPNSLLANHCSISFPLYNGMSNKEQEYVIDQVKNFTVN